MTFTLLVCLAAIVYTWLQLLTLLNQLVRQHSVILLRKPRDQNYSLFVDDTYCSFFSRITRN